MKYRNKLMIVKDGDSSNIVEGIQWTGSGEQADDITAFWPPEPLPYGQVFCVQGEYVLGITTKYGPVYCSKGNWLIKKDGRLSAMANHVFHITYEKVEDKTNA